MERYYKLFLGFIISGMFVYIARNTGWDHNPPIIEDIPFISGVLSLLMSLAFNILFLIGIFGLFKFSYIWTKELIKLK